MAELDIDGLERGLRIHPSIRIANDDFNRAAVALVFRPALDVLFIRRSEREGDPWSGHMAFPGGRVDARDASPRAAAERETWEEVGIDLSQARFLGPLDEIASPVRVGKRRLVISPFAYALPEPVEPRFNHEVAAIYWFHLDRLLRGEGRGTFSLRWMGQDVPMPVVRLEDADIWGLTLRIVDDLVRRLQVGQQSFASEEPRAD